MIFADRIDAGMRLGDALQSYSNRSNAIVIALPRGGVVVGYEVAKKLHLSLDIVCPRKIGSPLNPEFAIGAITETGECILSKEIIKELEITDQFIKTSMEQEKEKAQWRLDQYRKGHAPRILKDKSVILIDDGIATGATMQAAIKTIRIEKAKEIILAVPVAPPSTIKKLAKEVDKVVCLTSPSSFYAVGQFYTLFDQVSDSEVIRLLNSQ